MLPHKTAKKQTLHILNCKSSTPSVLAGWTDRSSQRWSTHLMLLDVPNCRIKTDRAFAVAAPSLWNILPVHIRTAQSTEGFRSLLKTCIFCFYWSLACISAYAPIYCAFNIVLNVLLILFYILF